MDQIGQACAIDLEAYRTAELLRARAHGWSAAGRRSDDVIGSQPWPRALTFSSPAGKAINDVAELGGKGVILADGGGSLWASADGITQTKLVTLSTRPLLLVSASTDGRSVVASDGDQVFLVDGSTHRSVPAPPGISTLSISPDGTRVIASSRTEVRLLDPATMTWVHVARYPRVLDVSAESGRALAAVSDSRGDLGVVDVEDGRIVLQTGYPVGELGSAAISPAGTVVAAGQDRPIWNDAGGSGFVSTGIVVPDILSTLALTAQGEVLYGASQFGAVRSYDIAHAMALPPICRTLVTVSIAVATDGSQVFCRSTAEGPLWSLADIRPASYSGVAGRRSAGSDSVTLSRAGQRMRHPDQPRTLRPPRR